jgi:chorismate mutase-like protein
MVPRVPTRSIAALLAALALLVVAAPAPAGAADADLDGARTVLQLSQQRLSYMRTVMAAKWFSRSPVEDTAQEATVLDTARAAGAERGLRPESVAGVFAHEISAAQVVQLGWGREWLLHGFPAGETAPDLAAVRPQIAALTPQIADALVRTDRLHCVRRARARLLREAKVIVTTPHVTARARRGLVDAILDVRPVSRRAACPGG